MAKRVMRTEAQEVSNPDGANVGDPVWFYERSNGHAYEHLARIEAMHPDGTADLSFQVRGEIGRSKAERIPRVNATFTGSAWAKA